MELSLNPTMIDPGQADEIKQDAVRRNIPVYVISTGKRVGRAGFSMRSGALSP
jgi:hypothetical protein